MYFALCALLHRFQLTTDTFSLLDRAFDKNCKYLPSPESLVSFILCHALTAECNSNIKGEIWEEKHNNSQMKCTKKGRKNTNFLLCWPAESIEGEIFIAGMEKWVTGFGVIWHGSTGDQFYLLMKSIRKRILAFCFQTSNH